MRIRTATADLFAAALSFFIFGAVFYLSERFPDPVQFQLGAAVFPRLIAVVFALVGVLIVVTNRRSGLLARVTAAHTGEGVMNFPNVRELAVALAALVGYGMFFRTLGFVLATPIFLAVMLVTLGVRSKVLVPLVAVLGTAAIFVIFDLLLGVPLPGGIFRL